MRRGLGLPTGVRRRKPSGTFVKDQPDGVGSLNESLQVYFLELVRAGYVHPDFFRVEVHAATVVARV